MLFRSGIFNGFCRKLSQSSLSGLFNTPGLKGAQKPSLNKIKIDKTVRGQRLRFSADRALTSSEAPAFQVNQVGQGLAILLNFNLSAAAYTAKVKTPLQDL